VIIFKVVIAACLVALLAALIYSLVEQARGIRAKVAQDIKRAMEEEPGAIEEIFGEDGLYVDAPHMNAPRYRRASHQDHADISMPHKEPGKISKKGEK